MKIFRFFTAGIFVFLAVYFTSCDDPEIVIPSDESILPQLFKVDIPGALSRDKNTSNERKTAINELNGNEIYTHLTYFINVGEGAADIVDTVITIIAQHGINRPMSFLYKSSDDGRDKRLNVIKDSEYDSLQWEYQLTIIDVESEDNEDKGRALQMFWNRDPLKSISLVKPYNLDRNYDDSWSETTFKIDYSREPYLDYQAHMMVYITGLPLASPAQEPFAMRTMKMFAGKRGNLIDVFGNSDHPAAILFSGQAGINWAFVAVAHDTWNLGVVEIGLPPIGLDESNREVLLKDYSIKNVFTREIEEVWPGIDESVIADFFINTNAPGYFNPRGFIRSGISPDSKFNDLEERMNDLSPFNPREIRDLSIEFK